MKRVGVLISLIQNKTSQSNLSRLLNKTVLVQKIGDLNFSQMWVFINPPAIKTTQSQSQWYSRPLSIENSPKQKFLTLWVRRKVGGGGDDKL